MCFETIYLNPSYYFPQAIWCYSRRTILWKRRRAQTKTQCGQNQETFVFLCVQMDLEELYLLFSTYKPSTLFVPIKWDVNLSPPYFSIGGNSLFPDGDGWWLAGRIRVCCVFPYIIRLSLSVPPTICTCVALLPRKYRWLMSGAREGSRAGRCCGIN